VKNGLDINQKHASVHHVAEVQEITASARHSENHCVMI
jgi:hypothetical protein